MNSSKKPHNKIKAFFLFILIILLLSILVIAIDNDIDGVEDGIDQCSNSDPFDVVGPTGCHENLNFPQSCTNGIDSAIENTCSQSKPLYCNGLPSLHFENNCELCGCDEGEICGNDGNCNLENIGTVENPSNEQLNVEIQESLNPIQSNILPSHSTDCYNLKSENNCLDFGCYWDTRFFDQCYSYCYELSKETDCIKYSTCLLIQTGFLIKPILCIDPYEVKNDVHLRFSLPIGEVNEGESITIPLEMPKIGFARTTPDIECNSITSGDGFNTELLCDDAQNPPSISLKITGLEDHQCKGDKISRLSLGCDYGICTIDTPQTYLIIIHDKDC